MDMQFFDRIHEARKITRRYRKDVKMLVERLDRHRDPFRSAVIESAEARTESVKSSRPLGKVSAIPRQERPLTVAKKPGPKRKPKAEKVFLK